MIWIVLGTLGIVAAVVAAGVVLDRRLGVLPRPAALRDAGAPGPTYGPGEAAETALPVAPRGVRCRACRHTTVLDDQGSASYGDRELVIRRYRCTRCAATTTLYCRT